MGVRLSICVHMCESVSVCVFCCELNVMKRFIFMSVNVAPLTRLRIYFYKICLQITSFLLYTVSFMYILYVFYPVVRSSFFLLLARVGVNNIVHPWVA